ncbi:hypothetical protein [Pseudopedobacter beijingensis]|uniref:Lipocalin-like domain-containing protein n=1 Tax=Pseudopedobacter beijingensis TaxID=1207056 RepID=A0ABW4I8P0_9SPHI
MKYFYILCLLLFSVTSFGQAQTTAYQNIQGKWICITPKYQNHTFWVKGTSFFQKFQNGVLEQGLPYQITKPTGEDIDVVGLFVKCKGCFDDVWTISELTRTKLILINYATEEIAEYKKVIVSNVKKK